MPLREDIMEDFLVLTKNPLWLLLLSAFIAWSLRYHWKRRNLYLAAWKRPGPFSLPFLGHAYLFLGSSKRTLKNMMKLARLYKSPVPIWIGPKLVFSIAEAQDVEIVLNSPNALEKSELYEPIKMAAGQGIFLAPVSTWKRHRKIIMPAWNQKILNTFVPLFAEQSDVLLEQLEKHVDKGEFNIFDYVMNCIIEKLSETVMGVATNVHGDNSGFVKWTSEAMDIANMRIWSVWYHSDFIFRLSHHSKKLNDLISKINNFIDDVILRKREEYRVQYRNGTASVDEGFVTFAVPQKNNRSYFVEFLHKKSFLDLLIELSENSTAFTNQELREEVLTFMLAGSDTSASIISYLFMVFGMYPEVQVLLLLVYEEIVDVLGLHKPVEHTDLKKFLYLNRVLRETLRLFPPAPFIARALATDVKLGECTLPAGSSAMINIIGLHRDPFVYSEPLKFDPDRFLKEEVAKRHPYSWLPFSGGPRNCIGSRYSFMSNTAVIASVVRKFKFSSKYKRIEDIDLKAELMLRPTDGYKVSIELRK
ncbi:hypothetical protein FQR65_LT11320 [Abscondita terminalis]|nr:hypothetical protein FQR65_LT11320 [Abscondita terminalis]